MLTVILLVVGVLVVAGAVYLVMSSGTKSGRHEQSAQSVVVAQRQEKMRTNTVRASGGDD
jgi:flagellar basal body-associated protein FliL